MHVTVRVTLGGGEHRQHVLVPLLTHCSLKETRVVSADSTQSRLCPQRASVRWWKGVMLQQAHTSVDSNNSAQSTSRASGSALLPFTHVESPASTKRSVFQVVLGSKRHIDAKIAVTSARWLHVSCSCIVTNAVAVHQRRAKTALA